jgi:hypothetical protein
MTVLYGQTDCVLGMTVRRNEILDYSRYCRLYELQNESLETSDDVRRKDETAVEGNHVPSCRNNHATGGRRMEEDKSSLSSTIVVH